MAVAGSGEARLHLLSVGLAALAVPAGWAAARAVATPRAAWICAGLLAVNPMLTEYADQARMYTLLATASLVALAALAGVLVHRGRAAVLIVVAGAGLVALTRRRPRVDPARTGLLVAVTVAAVTLATALAYAQVALAWAPRYLALLAGPFVVLASIGLAQMGGLGV